MTVLVTVNRYVAVCRPFDATDFRSVKRQAKRHVMLVLLFSVLFNLSRFFEYEIDSSSTTNKLVKTSLTTDPFYEVSEFLVFKTRVRIY
jgi:hypothetical protein